MMKTATQFWIQIGHQNENKKIPSLHHRQLFHHLLREVILRHLGMLMLNGLQAKVLVIMNFREGDPFTELLQEHEHLIEVRLAIALRVREGNYNPDEMDYDLGGLQGVPKYARDYSTLLTLGQTGNLAVTYLGSYDLDYYVVSVESNEGNAEILFHAQNASTAASATHPPVIGYTDFYLENIAPFTDNLFAYIFGSTGPMSKTTQSFWWTETIYYK
jgi:hypothetical protein